MNIILAEQDEIQGTQLILEDHRAKHIIKILGCTEGDTLLCGVINGLKGTGKIVSLKKKFPFRVELEVHLFEQVDKQAFIDLVIALPRPIMLRRILSQATSLGVGKIFLVNANRVEKSFWDASILEPSTYREHLIQGLEQAVDTHIPRVEFHRRFKPFVEDFLSTITGDYSHRLLAHPYEDKTLMDRLQQKAQRVLLAVGPEGGWVEYELEKFQQAGFQPFTIGERILKVDTAVISLHGRITAIKESLEYQAKA